jgi:hypothetical protein
MNFTTEDTRKFISSIYQWATTNGDFDFIKMSIDDCYSEECTQLRYQLEIVLRKTRVLLNQLAESIDEMDVCIRQLKLSIEKERAIRKKAKIDQRQKKREE